MCLSRLLPLYVEYNGNVITFNCVCLRPRWLFIHSRCRLWGVSLDKTNGLGERACRTVCVSRWLKGSSVSVHRIIGTNSPQSLKKWHQIDHDHPYIPDTESRLVNCYRRLRKSLEGYNGTEYHGNWVAANTQMPKRWADIEPEAYGNGNGPPSRSVSKHDLFRADYHHFGRTYLVCEQSLTSPLRWSRTTGIEGTV